MKTIQVIAAWLLQNMSILRLLGRLAKSLLLGEKVNLEEELQAELNAIRAETEARKEQIKNGTEEALRLVEEKHREAIKVLAEKEADRVEDLRKDPPQLALAAVRAARAARVARTGDR